MTEEDLKQVVRDLKASVAEDLAGVSARLDELASRMAFMLDVMELGFLGLTERLSALETRVGGLEERVSRLERKFGQNGRH